MTVKKSKENPTSIWEILEIVQSASESVKPFAIKFAQKVASMELQRYPVKNTAPKTEEESSPTYIATTS